jgi:hypothetical protein
MQAELCTCTASTACWGQLKRLQATSGPDINRHADLLLPWLVHTRVEALEFMECSQQQLLVNET